MKRKTAIALAGAATVMAAVSGCGSSDSKTVAYAGALCDKAQPQFQKIHDANNNIIAVSKGDHTPDEVKSTDSAAFQQISQAYRALADGLSAAGIPPVANGAQLQQNAVKELRDVATAYTGLEQSVDALDTRDQAKFGNGLKPVAAQLDSVSKTGDDALKTLQSGDLGTAMAQQPGCQAPTSSPTITASAAPSDGSASQGAGGASAPSASTGSGGSAGRSGSSSAPSRSAASSGAALGG